MLTPIAQTPDNASGIGNLENGLPINPAGCGGEKMGSTILHNFPHSTRQYQAKPETAVVYRNTPAAPAIASAAEATTKLWSKQQLTSAQHLII
jgi:hypothetical protein